MAAPTFAAAGNGATFTLTNSPADTCSLSTADLADLGAGDVVVLQVLVDGTSTTLTITTAANGVYEALDGTDNTLTEITGSPFNVGSPTAARMYLWIGRVVSLSGGTLTFTVTQTSAGNDLYSRAYVFRGVNTGTTLASVVESIGSGAGTSTTVADVGVTTTGADRLACNFIGVNDDNNLELTAMTGETGGDWTYPVTAFGSSTGTDGAIALVTATIASAGTIDGGSDTITSDGWGVAGFALIPAGAASHSGAVVLPLTFERVTAGTVQATTRSLIYQPGTELAIPRSLYRR